MASVDLRAGDCLDSASGLASLADKSIDHAITDPPFDARTHRAAMERGNWRNGTRRVDGQLPFAPLTQEQLELAASQLARVTRRWIVVFAGELQLDTWRRALEAGGARFVRYGIVERKNPRPQMTGDRPAPAADLVVIAHGAGEALRWNGGGRPARWEAGAARFDSRTREQLHPCQKTLALMRALVEDFTEPGELVLDPFAGSGTTLVAAKELGRSGVGWERAPEYFDRAIARLTRTREQLRLEVAPPAEQLELEPGCRG